MKVFKLWTQEWAIGTQQNQAKPEEHKWQPTKQLSPILSACAALLDLYLNVTQHVTEKGIQTGRVNICF